MHILVFTARSARQVQIKKKYQVVIPRNSRSQIVKGIIKKSSRVSSISCFKKIVFKEETLLTTTTTKM